MGFAQTFIPAGFHPWWHVLMGWSPFPSDKLGGLQRGGKFVFPALVFHPLGSEHSGEWLLLCQWLRDWGGGNAHHAVLASWLKKAQLFTLVEVHFLRSASPSLHLTQGCKNRKETTFMWGVTVRGAIAHLPTLPQLLTLCILTLRTLALMCPLHPASRSSAAGQWQWVPGSELEMAFPSQENDFHS